MTSVHVNQPRRYEIRAGASLGVWPGVGQCTVQVCVQKVICTHLSLYDCRKTRMILRYRSEASLKPLPSFTHTLHAPQCFPSRFLVDDVNQTGKPAAFVCAA